MSASFREAAASSDRMFWLDGGGARPWSGSRSVLGVLADDDVSLTYDAGTRTVLRHQGGSSEVVGDDIFTVLEEQVALDGGDPEVSWVGYLGYACRPDLPARPSTSLPDAVWMRVPSSLRLRHRGWSPGQPSRMTSEEPPAGTSSGVVAETATPHDAAYAEAFAEVQRQLRLGNSYEVNLTYREQVESSQDPVTAYLRLRELNPAPYSGYLQHRGVHLLSSSPERFATVDRHRTLEARPIKGTTPRGATAEEDERHRHRLATDPKYRAENLMIVDLLRNDLSMVCDPGTVTVPSLMEVESYESVHQLVSTVRGRLRDEVTTIGALRALFPAGSMTGAPKRRTMEIIDAVEATPRGVYAGAFGWLSGDGRADLSVVIRSLVTSTRGGSTAPHVYELGTGGGITVRSELEEEWDETRWKAARLRAALDGSLP
ncbi:MAG TPA: anthranilate synthase component I family protein [Marmoricola sp.]|nr:anthranilate synthase component I family protein [Marmoricola sp.]